MKKLFVLIATVICIHNVAMAQVVFDDSHAQSCASRKEALHDRISKRKRAGVYPNALMQRYDVKHYFLDMTAERNTTQITGSTTLKVLTTAITDTFCFELNKNLTLDSIEYNNTNIAFARDNNSITYALLGSMVPSNSLINIKVYYRGDAGIPSGTGAAIGDGYNTGTSGSWGNQATWSLSEPYSAVDWFACKQFLTDKADSATVHITTSNLNKAGSNGVLVGVETVPGNKLKYMWHTKYPIDYYLISIAVAKYVDYTFYAHPTALPNDSIKIVNYVYDNPQTLIAFKPEIDSIALFLDNYSNLFNLYPFWKEKYGNCMAPFGGGMEHQTMTSVGNLGNMGLNTHELLHHWFGDYVTCKTWSDIYINEGLTSYGEILTVEKYRSAAVLATDLNDLNNSITSQLDGSVYCPDTTSVSRIFSSRLSYDKGSMVTHTLRFVLGDTMFFRSMRNFLSTYANSTATIADLKTIAENTSSQNLTDIFNAWFYGEGYPIWDAQYYSTGNHVVLNVKHAGSVLSNNLYKMPLEIKLLSPSGDSTIKVNITSNSDMFVIPSNKSITGLQIDPNIKMARKIGTISQNPALITNMNVVADNSNQIQLNVQGNNLLINSSKAFDAQIINSQGAVIDNIKIVQGIQNFSMPALSPGLYIIKAKGVSQSFIK